MRPRLEWSLRVSVGLSQMLLANPGCDFPFTRLPRCDLLACVLVVKLAPFYRKSDRLLTEAGRYRKLPSWRRGFI